ncbi:MAG: alpha-2-macroglobulin, partial [Acidobacteria bacterium]
NHSNGSARPSLASEDAGLTVKANGEERADWVVAVKKPGSAKLKVFARNDRYADAMQKALPVYEHGLEKFISTSGKMRGDDITVQLDLPLERRPGSTHLMVQLTPSLAVTLLDALPYLIDYPYGCTEQTMSRFLPSVITSKTLRDLGIQPEAVMNKIFGGVVQEQSNKTQPGGKKDLRQLDDMVKQGLERLYDFQHGDGGWGWWKQGESDHFMSAYVVWGLTLARDAGIKLRVGVLDRGAGYLDKELVEEEASHDVQSWMLHALSFYHASSKQRQVGSFQANAFENLWTHRDQLNAYTRSLLALSAHQFGYTDKAMLLIQNLENGVKRDTRPDTSVLQVGAPNSNGAVMDTAHWGEDGIYWRWSDGGVEATSFALRALLAVDPKNKLIEPVTHWLLQNRRGAQWSNTRDTAITVLALNDYLRRSSELATSLEYELQVNGHSIVTRKVIPTEALSAPSQFEIDPKFLKEGTNEIRILRKNGSGPLYFSAQASFFSLEEPITAAGNGIFAYRQYYKLVPRPTLLKGYFYDKQPLNSGDNVSSGERVEMVVTIEAKNNHEYLVFEDLKPAGLEAVQIRSGGPLFARELKSGVVTRLQSQALNSKLQVEESDYTGRQRWVYQELRDRQVALFIDKLPEGLWEIRYDLRAEVPGTFHALPVVGHAMYVPEIRCNGVESQIIVRDLKQNKIVARTVFTNRLVR